MAKRRSTDAGFSGGVICLSQSVRSLATSELRDDAIDRCTIGVALHVS
ncbi:hypothetical protein B0O95_102155 [Mycetohabitans endofungorum]|uniref:Uncharacterized protein n=1 Tax=Mycetohabitans endofungorum TaxID=417203 RepID=A0A2P5KDJ4_9BURK|nr:hypothetical protein [Mycetohabitans endofungorum]PPB84755.1 hypothetical protein B0O95_102155 [Mycetohabitans endofungorum]